MLDQLVIENWRIKKAGVDHKVESTPAISILVLFGDLHEGMTASGSPPAAMGKHPNGWYSNYSRDHLLSLQGPLVPNHLKQPRGLRNESETCPSRLR